MNWIGVLISCAMPADSWPIDSSFCACASSCSSFFCCCDIDADAVDPGGTYCNVPCRHETAHVQRPLVDDHATVDVRAGTRCAGGVLHDETFERLAVVGVKEIHEIHRVPGRLRQPEDRH